MDIITLTILYPFNKIFFFNSCEFIKIYNNICIVITIIAINDNIKFNNNSVRIFT